MTINHHQRARLIRELRETIRDAEQAAALRGSAEEWLRDTQRMRRERLASLQELRRAARETFETLPERIKAQSRVRPYVRPKVYRLHPETLYEMAARLFDYAASPLPGAPGCEGTYVMDDGYSLCGLADADCAAREGAREEAALLAMAGLLLDHRIGGRHGAA